MIIVLFKGLFACLSRERMQLLNNFRNLKEFLLNLVEIEQLIQLLNLGKHFRKEVLQVGEWQPRLRLQLGEKWIWCNVICLVKTYSIVRV